MVNVAPILKVKNFTNWKKMFMCHIVGIESQFKNIILNGPYVPMVDGVHKPEAQWSDNERKYEKNLIESIYETENKKSLTTETPLSTAFISTSIVQDFQDSPNDEEDTRSSQEYKNDLEMEFHERALLAKSKRFFKKDTQRFSGAKDVVNWDEEEVSSDANEMVKVKVPVALVNDENGVVGKGSARNGECEQIPNQKRKILGGDQLTKDPSSSGQKDIVFVKSSEDDTNVYIPNVEGPWLSKDEGFNLPNHDTGRILPSESQVKVIDSLVNVIDSSVTDYDSAEESSLVCSTPLTLLEKVAGVEPVSGPKTIKPISKSYSTVKTDTLIGVIINEPTHSSAPTKGNKNVLVSKKGFVSAGKLKNVKTEDDIPLSVVMKELNDLKLQIFFKISRPLKPFPPCKHYRFNDHQSDVCINYPTSEICRSYDHDIKGHNRIISLRRGIKPRNPQRVIKSYDTCVSTVHTITDHNDNEWFRRGEALQAKKTESSNSNRSKTLTKSGCSRHMISIKSHMHKYVEQPDPEVVFGDDSTCTTEGYGSIICNGIFDEKRGIIFNSNKEVVMISPRVRDVYVLDMISSTQESCFVAKASKSLN
ncbi:hypothetical protein Tco_1050755 [Tanacetum coccineum]